ncbi:MAG: hypothetical protein ACK5TN_01560 [Acidobacteriota bacterium]
MGIAVTTLDSYLRREKERERKQAGLLPVALTAPAAGRTLTLILGDGQRLEVPVDFDEATLLRLLSVLV